MIRYDFDRVFGDDYLHFSGDMLTDERSDMDVELIVRLLGLQSGMRVLDVACGHGRIANRLAQLGCEVVGIDNSAMFLEVARQAGRPVDYRLADMRELPPDGPFDQSSIGSPRTAISTMPPIGRCWPRGGAHSSQVGGL
jgi:2-polyprenyl-3-methyl-5-hydroxy-6-metoxy-1,4-benzoquinol methylase